MYQSIYVEEKVLEFIQGFKEEELEMFFASEVIP